MMHRIAILFALGVLGCGGKAVIDGAATSGGGNDGAGGSTGTDGVGGNPSCDALEAEYGTALAQAKRCDPFVSSLQCTQAVKSAFTCGCTTYANPGNSQALETLSELETEWLNMGCFLPIPCPIGCPVPQGSACEYGGAGGNFGSCQDLF